MTPHEAALRIDALLAHAWMVRTFLKHADEIQEDEELLEVPRTIFDYCRAVEPARERQDWAEYLHRARGKLGKLKRAAEFFSREHLRASDHTNFRMAAASLTEVVHRIDEVLASQPKGLPG